MPSSLPWQWSLKHGCSISLPSLQPLFPCFPLLNQHFPLHFFCYWCIWTSLLAVPDRSNSRWALVFLIAFLHTLTTSQYSSLLPPCASSVYICVLTGVPSSPRSQTCLLNFFPGDVPFLSQKEVIPEYQPAVLLFLYKALLHFQIFLIVVWKLCICKHVLLCGHLLFSYSLFISFSLSTLLVSDCSNLQELVGLNFDPIFNVPRYRRRERVKTVAYFMLDFFIIMTHIYTLFCEYFLKIHFSAFLGIRLY